MVKKFEFKDNGLKLDIAGDIYTFDTTDVELVKRVLSFASEAQAKAESLEKEDDYVKALKETIQFCIDSIDSILGEDASKKIFAGRTVSLFDALDVINYVINEIKEDRESKFQAYSPNRAQRRASK